MCLLTYIAPGAMPNTDHLYNGSVANNDGHGWAIVCGDRLVTGRSMNADQAISEFTTARQANPEGAAMFHSRWTTHGVVGLVNVHPFKVRVRRRFSDRILIGHNGVLPGEAQPPVGDWRSDTRLFAEDLFMTKFQHLDSDKTRRRLESWLGNGNRLVILTTDPRYKQSAYIFNESHGTWIDGSWYSNGGYLPYREKWSYYSDRGTSNAMTWWEDAETTSIGYVRDSAGNWVRTSRTRVTVPTCVWCGSRNSIWQDMCTACTTCQNCGETSSNCDCEWDHATQSMRSPVTTADIPKEVSEEVDYALLLADMDDIAWHSLSEEESERVWDALVRKHNSIAATAKRAAAIIGKDGSSADGAARLVNGYANRGRIEAKETIVIESGSVERKAITSGGDA